MAKTRLGGMLTESYWKLVLTPPHVWKSFNRKIGRSLWDMTNRSVCTQRSCWKLVNCAAKSLSWWIWPEQTWACVEDWQVIKDFVSVIQKIDCVVPNMAYSEDTCDHISKYKSVWCAGSPSNYCCVLDCSFQINLCIVLLVSWKSTNCMRMYT